MTGRDTGENATQYACYVFGAALSAISTVTVPVSEGHAQGFLLVGI